MNGGPLSPELWVVEDPRDPDTKVLGLTKTNLGDLKVYGFTFQIDRAIFHDELHKANPNSHAATCRSQDASTPGQSMYQDSASKQDEHSKPRDSGS